MLLVHKSSGETLSELLSRIRFSHNISPTIPITYAGRLDPMAEGLVLLLIGKEEVKRKNHFLNLDKIYETKILFGISTDTHDPLGLIINTKLPVKIIEPQLIPILKKLQGITEIPYPIYSSKTVHGKPLWQWSREGKAKNISIPKRNIKIYSIKLGKVEHKTIRSIIPQILENISKVRGNFRQQNIAQDWKRIDQDYKNESVTIANLSIHCSSGTYIRMLAKIIGEQLQVPTLAFHINRIQVGNYSHP